MLIALANEVHRQGRMDDHLISTTKIVDARLSPNMSPIVALEQQG